MLRLMMALLFVCLISSCGRADPLPADHVVRAFRDQYAAISVESDQPSASHESVSPITLTADGVTLTQLLRLISDYSGVSVICAKDLDGEKVSLDVVDVPVEQVLGSVARRLNQRLTKIGKVYFIGQVSPEDRGVLVRRVRRLDHAGLKSVLELFRSEYGRAESFSDGLVVVSDRVEVLERVDKCLTQIENSESGSWVVQIYLVSMSERFKRSLGIDLSNTVKFSWDVNSAANSQISGTVDALLVAAYESPEARVAAQPLLLIRDGSSATIISGDSVPIPKKTVSDQGTVSTTGFDNVQTGLTVKVGVRDETAKRCASSFFIELSTIAGYVEYAPIIRKQSFTSDVSLESGGVYLLGSLVNREDASNIRGNVVPSIFEVERNASEIQVFAKVYRIRSPLRVSDTVVVPPAVP